MSEIKDLLTEFISNPEVQKLQDELAAFIKETYDKFDNTVFVGDTCGGLVRVEYCFKGKGFTNVDVDDSIFRDKQLALDFIPIAINGALSKYQEEYGRVQKLISDREAEIYNKLVEVAQRSVTATQDNVTTSAPSKTKTYLN
jgi:DNA-binding protein YbaB